MIPNYEIISKILYPEIAQDLLFQMRYGSLTCSKKWLSERINWRGMFLRLEGATVLESCENRSWLCLSDCHLAVTWSWAGHHISFERGISGLPADMKIRTIVQLIGILWSYFGMLWGLPTTLYILVCHSATFRYRAGYHMANVRGHPKLSYEV